MAVAVSELLAFAKFACNQFPKSVVCSTLASFYHDDELSAAKIELCRFVNTLATPPDGWARLVNNRGGPITRKASDAAGKRTADAEDVHMMLAVLDMAQDAKLCRCRSEASSAGFLCSGGTSSSQW